MINRAPFSEKYTRGHPPSGGGGGGGAGFAAGVALGVVAGFAVCVPAGAGGGVVTGLAVGVATGFAVGVGVGFGDWVCMAAETAPNPPTTPPGERNISPIARRAVSLRVRPVRMAIGRTDTQFASQIEVSKWGET